MSSVLLVLTLNSAGVFRKTRHLSGGRVAKSNDAILKRIGISSDLVKRFAAKETFIRDRLSQWTPTRPLLGSSLVLPLSSLSIYVLLSGIRKSRQVGDICEMRMYLSSGCSSESPQLD